MPCLRQALSHCGCRRMLKLEGLQPTTIGVRASHGNHIYNYYYDDIRTAKVTAILV